MTPPWLHDLAVISEGVGIVLAVGLFFVLAALPQEPTQLCAGCLRGTRSTYCSRPCREADEAAMRRRTA